MASPSKTTVVSPASTFDLTVLETVKQELDVTDASNDAWFARTISEQSRLAASFCDREFAKETLIDTFYLDNGASVLWTSRKPIVSVSSVVEAGFTLASTDYDFNESRLWRLNGSGQRIGWKFGTTIVTYVGGYDLLTTLPRDVERAVILMIKQAYYEKVRDPRVTSESVDGVGSIRLDDKPDSVPSEAADILRGFIASFAY